MANARDFYQGLRGVLNTMIDSVRPWRGSITDEAFTGDYFVTPAGSDTQLAEPVAQLKGFGLALGEPPQEVVVLPLGGSHLILGKIDNGLDEPEGFSFPVMFNGGMWAITGLGPGYGTFDTFEDVNVTDDHFIVKESMGGVETLNVDPTTQTITAKAISATSITGTSFNSPIFQTEAQSASDAASTTSTVNYSAAITASLALPTGTWSVAAQGGLSLTHSAGGTVNMQVNIDGDQGTARALTASATVPIMMISEHAIGGRTGTISCTVRFKSSTAGTTTASNPWLILMARRTA